MLLIIAVWIATIAVSVAIVIVASRKATGWPGRKKVSAGIMMAVPTIVIATVMSTAIMVLFDISNMWADSSARAMAIGFMFVLAALLLILYFIFAAIYGRLGGHRN